MKKVGLSIMTAFISLVLFAQEKGTDVEINVNKDKGGSSFWGSPVMWVVGAAIFILLLVAVTRGSSSRQS